MLLGPRACGLCGWQGQEWGQPGASSKQLGPLCGDGRGKERDSHTSLLPLAHLFQSRSRGPLLMGVVV